MDGIFNAVDILKIAETIERDGSKFYREASKLFPDDEIAILFTKLAEWEVQHEKIFAGMREKIKQHNPKLGPGTDEYKAVAALSTFSFWSEPYRQFSGIDTKQDVIRQALQKEKDTIVFYVGLKDFVAEIEDQDIINEVIREELKHIAILTDVLRKTD